MVFCTQRATQPFSRDETALDVKSSMQDMKQLSTRLPKSYTRERKKPLLVRCFRGQGGERLDPLVTYTDKLLHLALLHALLELALLVGVESSQSVRIRMCVSYWIIPTMRMCWIWRRRTLGPCLLWCCASVCEWMDSLIANVAALRGSGGRMQRKKIGSFSRRW